LKIRSDLVYLSCTSCGVESVVLEFKLMLGCFTLSGCTDTASGSARAIQEFTQLDLATS